MKLTHALVPAVCAALVAVGLAAPTPAAAADDVTWLVVSNSDALPADFEARVARAGGAVSASYPFGVAKVQAPRTFAGVAGTTAVVDSGFRLEQQPQPEAPEVSLPPTSGDDDFFFDLQWGHAAVRSPQAWADGVTGEGVRVAVLDTAFDVDHPDLAQNLNLELSCDFTEQPLSADAAVACDPSARDVSTPEPQSPTDRGINHGTMVAGTIAAADNGYGTIGIAPDAELVLLQVFSGDTEGDQVGQWADILGAIAYAAGPTVDADVINLSLGETVTRRGSESARLILAVNRAIRWAHLQGSTVIASAGNEARNLDRSGTQVRLPASSPFALAIGATTPLGWALDPDTDFTVPASTYTNYGRATVDFSAPGGDILWTLANGQGKLCSLAGLEPLPCGVFDLVFTTSDFGGWTWTAGTSQAAAHASGVAALVISESGGTLTPSVVERELRQRAINERELSRGNWSDSGFVTSGR